MYTRSLEPLESRIAPAVYFVSGTSLTIASATQADAADTPAEMDAITLSGATKAVLLGAGDSLVFDRDGDRVLDRGEPVLLKVTAGSAMAFFTDLNTNAGDTAHFDMVEWTGLVLGDGANAIIGASVHGPVDTLLTANGELTTARQLSSIAGLKITGSIDGSLQAGGNISNVIFTPAKNSYSRYDVAEGIFTGNAAVETISLNGGSTSLTTTFVQPVGSDAGDITNVKVPRGTFRIATGSGGNSPDGNGGAGGDISGITGGGRIVEGIVAGNGGVATGGTGSGGQGGSISKTTLVFTTEETGYEHNFYAGNGGASVGGHGGLGGSVSGLSATFTTGLRYDLDVRAGRGGMGGGTGTGGDGGALAQVTIKSATSFGSVSFSAGGGGDGGANGAGGNGGALGKLNLSAIDAESIDIRAGMGGDAGDGKGGNGGDLKDTSVVVTGKLGSLSISAGDGRTGGGTGDGGTGGAMTNLTVKATGLVDDEVEITGGGAGDGGSGSGSGGVGGAVSKLNLTFGILASGISIESGRENASGTAGGNGGSAGNLSDVKLTCLAYVGGAVSVESRGGGNARGATGNGGDAASMSNITLVTKGGAQEIRVTAGDAGPGTTGNGGAGGAMTNVSITNSGPLDYASVNGSGGGTVGTEGDGGTAGDITGVKIVDNSQGTWRINPGQGSAGRGALKNGGDSGNITNFSIKAPNAIVNIGGDAAFNHSGTGGSAVAGDGGDLTNLSGSAGILLINAAPGGDSDAGFGGDGGSIKNVNFAVTQFARIIAAGDGGSTGPAGTAGFGGSVEKVKITGTGDIGEFTAGFGIYGVTDTGMGGLVAGKGGVVDGSLTTNFSGGISNVTATRIAAIVAGQRAGDQVGKDNGVRTILNVKAAVIGADADGDGSFDWNEGATNVAGFQLVSDVADQDDRAIDGLILTQFPASFAPGTSVLKKLEV